MLKNYIKTAFRSLLKDKAYSTINILGLSIGLAAFLLIYSYISFERSYDDFHELPDQLYRVTTDNVSDGTIGVRDAMSFAPEGLALKEEMPEVLEYTTTFKWFGTFNVRIGERLFVEKPVIAADNHFLKLFNYPIIAGDRDNPLSEPYSIVLTKTIAQKFFGDENPIGKSILVHSGMDQSFKVTALIDDVPTHTHYKFNMLVSLNSIQSRLDDDGWRGFNYYTYVRLADDVDLPSLQAKMPVISKKFMDPKSTLVFNFQKVKDIHLYSNFTYEPEAHGNAKTVGFLGIIAFSILIIAWVNYINLSTARSMERAREVGMRKVVGATRKHLLFQFLAESFVINFISICLALTFVQLIFPFYSNLLQQSGMPELWDQNHIHWIIGGLLLISTFLSGFYPSLVLSAYQPISILQGKFRTSSKGNVLRRVLVVFQFVASTGLIAGTVIVYNQIDYMRNQNLGIDLNQVVSIADPEFSSGTSEENAQLIDTYKNSLRSVSGVKGVAGASNAPDGGSTFVSSSSGGVKVIGQPDKHDFTIYISRFTWEYPELMGIQLLAGRSFMPDFASDTSSVIINESLMKRLNFVSPEKAVGQRIQRGVNPENTKWNIVGVMKDFNRKSLKHAVEPSMYHYISEGGARYMIVKMEGSRAESVMSEVRELYVRKFPDSPFQYAFLDEEFAKSYRDEEQFGTLFGVFASLAIFIACLGLFGLSSFIAVQKTKEIGVRKVLGASIRSIILLLYRNFLVLVLISMLLSVPTIYFVMDSWLDNYNYRISMPWWVFLLSTGALLLISFLTVSFQTLKAATANPVKSLKYE